MRRLWLWQCDPVRKGNMLALLRNTNTHGCTLYPRWSSTFYTPKATTTKQPLHCTKHAVAFMEPCTSKFYVVPDKPTFFCHPPNRTEEPSVYYFSLHANSNQEEGLVRWCKRSSRMTDWLCLSKSEWRSKDQVHGRRRRHPPSEQGSFQQRPGSPLLGVISFDCVTRSG